MLQVGQPGLHLGQKIVLDVNRTLLLFCGLYESRHQPSIVDTFGLTVRSETHGPWNNLEHLLGNYADVEGAFSNRFLCDATEGHHNIRGTLDRLNVLFPPLGGVFSPGVRDSLARKDRRRWAD